MPLRPAAPAASRRALTALTYVEPCLAAEIGAPPKSGRWLIEFKEDGYRTQLHRHGDQVRVFSRGGHDWTGRYATVAQEALKLRDQHFIIDGEMVVPRPDGTCDFTALQIAVANKDSEPIVFRVFDILMREGADVRSLPLIERKEKLRALLAQRPSDRLSFCEHETEIDGHTFLEHAHRLNVEGLMFKLLGSRYRSQRTNDWIKVPCQYREVFFVVGYALDKGKFDGLYLAREQKRELVYSGKVEKFGVPRALVKPILAELDALVDGGRQLTSEVRKEKARWVKPVLRAHIVHRAGLGTTRVRHAKFECWAEPPTIAAPAFAKLIKPAKAHAPAAARLTLADNIMTELVEAVVPTGAQLRAHWRKVAKVALPYLARRPLTLVRHVDGVTFYHKGPLPPLPPAVHPLEIRKADGTRGIRLWIDSVAGLLGLVDIGVVEVHPWAATIDDIERPDMMIFDLDPGEGVEWPFVLETAFRLRALLAAEGFDCWPKLTGGSGVHLVTPIKRSLTHEDLHRCTKALAERLARNHPGRYTTTPGARHRVGKLFIDFFRNRRGQTAAGCYSPRARPGLPIAMPTTWRALEDGIRPNAFTLGGRRSDSPK
ncbi:MAG: DNA ligase D [Alphaproteobacteria bacterium]|nr:MAG: DNA ligase D [Alphaproteobacteria bacterium]